MSELFIEKKFELEAQLKEHLFYIPLAGPSKMANFKSPDFYVFIFFEKSKGVHSVDFVEYKETDNQIHVSFPGQIHSWITESSLGHKLIVSKKFIETYLFETGFSCRNINSMPVFNITTEQADRLNLEFSLFAKEAKENITSPRIMSIRGQLIICLIHEMMYDHVLEADKNCKPDIIARFEQFIENHYIESKAVSFYGDLLGVSPNYLNIITKRETGITAKDFIKARVVLEGKRRLLGSNEPIKNIAFDLGFDSIANFSNYMYKNTGYSPSKLREFKNTGI